MNAHEAKVSIRIRQEEATSRISLRHLRRRSGVAGLAPDRAIIAFTLEERLVTRIPVRRNQTVRRTDSALPVVWLARRNPRAVLTGALLPALLLVYALGGLGLGGAGAGPRSDLGTMLLMWIVVMAVLLGLLLFSFSRMKGSFVERIKWTAVGVGVWVFVGTMVTRASGEVNDLRVEAETHAFVKHAAQAQADQRRELDRTPERRRAVLDSVLAQMKQGELGYRPLGRLLVFGDATTAPERVVLWTVVTPGPKDTWAAYSFYGERLHQRLNALLQERG